MKRTMQVSLMAALLLAAFAAASRAGDGDDRVAVRLRIYARLADHNLLQIMLVAPVAATDSALRKTAAGGWQLSGAVLCVDVGPLREPIVTREVREFPDDARKLAVLQGDFYPAVRFDPPRLGAGEADSDYRADLKAALARSVAAKLVKKVTVELNRGGSGCRADLFAVPALRFFKDGNAQSGPGSWQERMERGEVALLGVLSVTDLRAAHRARLGQAPRSADPETRAAAPAADVLYGALRVESGGGFKPCYVGNDDPLPQLVAWAMADSEKVKRWMSATPQSPKAIADLDTVLADFRKPAVQRHCTLLVASVSALARVKTQLEREKLAAALYPETASGKQVAAAYGFRSVDELKFARDLGIDSAQRFALLRSVGLDTRAGYEQALARYATEFGLAKPDAETLAAFVRDEREAAAKGTTVKALRAERARREDAKSRRQSAVSG